MSTLTSYFKQQKPTQRQTSKKLKEPDQELPGVHGEAVGKDGEQHARALGSETGRAPWPT
jgi:hypothetical protein